MYLVAKPIYAGLMLAALFMMPAAVAQDDADGALPSFIEPVDGAKACWSRNYDAAHLAAHPDQQVTAMALAMQYETVPASEDDPEGRAFYNYTLDVDLRDGTHGQAIGNCLSGEDGKIWCGVECDGGAVDVSHADGGAVLVDLERSGGIRLQYCGGEGDDVWLEPGLDDKQFLLMSQPQAECPAVVMPDWEAGID